MEHIPRAHIAAASFCKLMTFTYTQVGSCVQEQKAHDMQSAIQQAWSMGVATMANKYTTLFLCTLGDACRLCHSILCILKPVFNEFNRFFAVTTHSGAQISRFSDFYVHSDDNDNNRTNCFTSCICQDGSDKVVAIARASVYSIISIQVYNEKLTTSPVAEQCIAHVVKGHQFIAYVAICLPSICSH